MKKAVIIALSLFAFLLLPPSVSATEAEEIYSEQYRASGLGELSQALPPEVARELAELDISSTDTDWSEAFGVENVFERSFSFIKSGCKRPFIAALSVLALLLFSSAVESFWKKNRTVEYVISLGITVAAVLPAAKTLAACISAVSAVGIFMLSFVPIYSGILLSRGKSATAAGFSSVMLTVSEAVGALCSYAIMPLNGMQLALAVSGSVSDSADVSAIGSTLKKASTWTLSLATTVLLGVLGIQTAVAASADSLTAKTAKFIVGTAVPVVGSAVSEALSTVHGCLKLLSSSAAVYAVAAIALILLPSVTELILWRVALSAAAAAADILGVKKTASLLRSVDSAIAFTLGILIFTCVLFIISVTMVAVV